MRKWSGHSILTLGRVPAARHQHFNMGSVGKGGLLELQQRMKIEIRANLQLRSAYSKKPSTAHPDGKFTLLCMTKDPKNHLGHDPSDSKGLCA